MENKNVDTLFYDGACPLCAREIAKLKTLKRCPMAWVDISAGDALDADVPTKETLMRRLHVKTHDGRWLTGIDANIYAWRGTSLAWLWRILNFPLIHWCASRAYDFWAEHRYQAAQNKTQGQ